MRNILILALVFSACVTPDQRQRSAETNARTFATDSGFVITGVSCTGSDSDLDRYVSCTLFAEGEEPRAIECNYDVAWAPLGQAHGCKLVVFARGFAPTDY